MQSHEPGTMCIHIVHALLSLHQSEIQTFQGGEYECLHCGSLLNLPHACPTQINWFL